jgi:hypothetical protein
MEVLAGAAALVVAYILLLRGVGPVASWFYPLAWWPTILILDGVNYLRAGDSLILTRGRTFIILLPLSVTIWLVFEVWNLRLQNWSYIYVPRSVLHRWVGMVVSFSTVLPGIFEVADILETLRWPRSLRVRPVRVGPLLRRIFIALGLVFLAAPLAFPEYAFPLIWGGFVFLLEPWCHLRGKPSLLREWGGGSLLTFVRLLLGGLVAGLVWELHNYWAQTKWVYTVPHFEEWKIFEMPVLGFLGFPPFAVTCLVMTNAAPLLFKRIGGRLPRPAIPALVLIFWAATFAGIDRMTVVSHVVYLSNLGGMRGEDLDGLGGLGVRTLPDLLARSSSEGIRTLAASLDLPEGRVRVWVEEAELALHAGMGVENARVLRARGIRGVGDLRRADPAEIEGWLRADRRGHRPGPPRSAIVRLWLRAAR